MGNAISQSQLPHISSEWVQREECGSASCPPSLRDIMSQSELTTNIFRYSNDWYSDPLCICTLKNMCTSSFSWTQSQPLTGTCPTCKTVWPLSSQKWWFFKASWHRLQPLHHTDKENQKNRHNLLLKHLLGSNIGHILVHWALYLLNPQYTAFVVYFDQCLSAAHSKLWLKF